MKVCITHGDRTAWIAERGAELVSWKQRDRELLWSADPTYWKYSAPILFPIVGPQPGGPMKQHGFARLRDFTIEAQSQTGVTMVLRADGETRALYPYDFALRVRYTLTDDGLETAFHVENTGGQPLSYQIGGHPAFALFAPLPEYEVVLAPPDGRVVTLAYPLFYDNTLVYPDLLSRSVKLLHRQTGHGIEMDFADFDLLAVWQAKDAPFLSMEPLLGTRTLNPGEVNTHTYCLRALPG